MKSVAIFIAACTLSVAALAKLPTPVVSDDAKAKAAEAAAKTAHAGKVEGYLLCKSQDRAAAHYRRSGKAGNSKAVAMPPCANPGPFKPTAAAPAKKS